MPEVASPAQVIQFVGSLFTWTDGYAWSNGQEWESVGRSGPYEAFARPDMRYRQDGYWEIHDTREGTREKPSVVGQGCHRYARIWGAKLDCEKWLAHRLQAERRSGIDGCATGRRNGQGGRPR